MEKGARKKKKKKLVLRYLSSTGPSGHFIRTGPQDSPIRVRASGLGFRVSPGLNPVKKAGNPLPYVPIIFYYSGYLWLQKPLVRGKSLGFKGLGLFGYGFRVPPTPIEYLTLKPYL